MFDQNLSESEQMYLLSVEILRERGAAYPVSISAVAEYLNVAGVSANQMVHKLADLGWLEYQPYRGISLTEKGEELASHILHHRRLWQVFLEEKLGLDSEKADEIACRLEHVVPCDAVKRLKDFLGEPRYTREGLPVPELNHKDHDHRAQKLSQVEMGSKVEIYRLSQDVNIYHFLRNEGVLPRKQYTVDASGNHAIVIRDLEDNSVQLTRTVADQILILPVA